MTSSEILQQLEALGQDSIKKVLLKHDIREPLFGVKVEELKKIQKKIKNGYSLSLELYKTGVYDAMYLAGLIAEPLKMSKAEIEEWAETSNSPALCGNMVAWVAAESRYGLELALDWVKSNSEPIATAGWATLASLVALKDDKDLDIALIKELVLQVENNITTSQNKVKSAMNNFIISVGIYVKDLNTFAKEAALRIGKVKVDMGDTACKVPYAIEYIEKAETRGTIGKKKKEARC